MDNNDSERAGLLREIRDLLRPIADHFRPEYERRQAIRTLIGASEPRRRAWALMDGTKTQREIANASGMDEGNLSKYVKALRQAGAVAGDPPKRTEEV
jgi:hypothetical protein